MSESILQELTRLEQEYRKASCGEDAHAEYEALCYFAISALPDLLRVARMAADKQPQALEIMRKNDIVLDDFKDPMQKFAFTIYTDLCELHHATKPLLEKREEG